LGEAICHTCAMQKGRGQPVELSIAEVDPKSRDFLMYENRIETQTTRRQ
jgi:hypothetical protein